MDRNREKKRERERERKRKREIERERERERAQKKDRDIERNDRHEVLIYNFHSFNHICVVYLFVCFMKRKTTKK